MSLAKVLGNVEAVSFLRHSLERSRLFHAYLFAGPDNVGKTTVALELAKAANCLSPASAWESCGQCKSCATIDHGTHADVSVVRPVLSADEKVIRVAPENMEGSVFPVELARVVRRAAGHSPIVGRRKFFVLCESEKLTVGAQNALLKTLEEPGSTTTLVLCAANPSELLATIRSRTCPVRFGTVSPVQMRGFIGSASPEVCDQVETILHLSAGRPGLAVRLCRSRDLLAARVALSEVVNCLVGADIVDALWIAEEALTLSEKAWFAERACDPVASELDMKKDRVRVQRSCACLALAELERLFRAAWHGGEMTEAPPAPEGVPAHLGSALPPDALAQCLSWIEATRQHVLGNANVSLAMTVLLLKLIAAFR